LNEFDKHAFEGRKVRVTIKSSPERGRRKSREVLVPHKH
jgi:hypothetical protein